MNEYREELMERVVKMFGLEAKVTKDMAYALETYIQCEPMDRLLGSLVDSITSPTGYMTALREDYPNIWELQAMIEAGV